MTDPNLLTCVFPDCPWTMELTGPTGEDYEGLRARFTPDDPAAVDLGARISEAWRAIEDAAHARYHERTFRAFRAHLDTEHPGWQSGIAGRTAAELGFTP